MTAVNQVVDLSLEGEVAVITIDSPPVNALSSLVRDGLHAACDRAFSDADAKAIVLICAGRTFIAGADISEFGKPVQGVALETLHAFMDASPKPLVCAIHGTCLGGGTETALVCNYRIATPSAKLGLPEVTLGLIPGSGGTQRLPRLVGVPAALEMITSGAPVDATKAREMGLIDRLAGETSLRQDALAMAREMIGKPLLRVRDRTATANPEVFAEAREAIAKRFKGLLAQETAVNAIEISTRLAFDDGMAEEFRLFMGLMEGEQSRALRYAFFAQREAAKTGLPADTKVLPIKSVGVVGAGLMGSGIAMAFLSAGLPVILAEVKQAALDHGAATVRDTYESSVRRGRITAEQAQKAQGLLTLSLKLEDLAVCDLIIEAVFEDLAVKTELFAKLDAIAKPGALLASNTSFLDLNAIAAATSRPADVVGLHFFSPANIMKLVEVGRAKETSDSAVATAMAVTKTLGKTGVLVAAKPGYVGNRMLLPRQHQAEALVLEGASPAQVDKVFLDFGMPMGPFAMADLAGLNLGWKAETSTSSTLPEIFSEHGRFGQKSGGGFYDYGEDRKPKPSPIADGLITDFRAKKGITPRTISDQEIFERTIYPMINEGAKILEEHAASRASDIDLIWITGYGWPAYRGGPMFQAGEIGLSVVAEGLRKHGMTPAPLLLKLADEGKTFADL